MAEITTNANKSRSSAAQPETTRGGNLFVPLVDIFETQTELLLMADVPGVRSEDVDLHYEKGELMLHARVRGRLPAQGVMLKEYEEGDFHRVFSVHESIDASRIEASCKNGVLTVRLPKLEAVRPRQIKVNAE
jgi:HSP20 family molecular chaperone IbpA